MTPQPDAEEAESGLSGAGSDGVTHAHDRYFRLGLHDRAEQAALVADLFPGLAPLLNAAGFETVDGTFVDEHLRERHTDLLLRTRLAGHDVLIYVLIEHQRTVDPLMAIRMLIYQARIWERHLREHPDTRRLPLILPAVIYQGERPWTAPTDLRDLLDLDDQVAAEVAEYLPSIRYRLDDLTQLDLPDLHTRALTAPLRLMLTLLMRAPGNPHVTDLLLGMTEDVTTVKNEMPSGARHLGAAFTYITSVAEASDDDLRRVAKQLGPEVLEAYMTTAQALEAKGEAKGEARGEARGLVKGEARLLLKQLTLKFGALPDTVRDRTHAATTTELETWAERILTATTLDDVFA